MQYLLSIPLVTFIFRIVGLVLGIYVLVGIIQQAAEDWKNKGYKGIFDEIILGVLLMAAVALATLSPNGPTTLGAIADKIIGIFLAILNLVIDAINNFL